jgi:hypothetical protein
MCRCFDSWRDHCRCSLVRPAVRSNFFALGCEGNFNDWEIVGFSDKLTVAPESTSGQQCDEFTLRIHILRKSSFYMWKTIFPIWLLSLYSLKSYGYHPDDLDARDSLGSTLLLATFAMLYVTGSYLPKTDFLTSIDLITIATLALQFAGGCVSVIFFTILEYNKGDELVYNILLKADQVIGVLNFVAFVACNVYWLYPGWKKQQDIRRTALGTKTAVLDDGYQYQAITALPSWRGTDSQATKRSGLECLLIDEAGAFGLHSQGSKANML